MGLCAESCVSPDESSNVKVVLGVLDTEKQLLAEIKDSLSEMLTET